MALVVCPECEASVSATTDACPWCGYRLAVRSKDAGDQPQIVPGRDRGFQDNRLTTRTAPGEHQEQRVLPLQIATSKGSTFSSTSRLASPLTVIVSAIALVVVAVMVALITVRSGGSDSSRTELVAEACDIEESALPPESDWELVSELKPPEVRVSLPGGGMARLNFEFDTTVDQVDNNLRITGVSCFSDPDAWATQYAKVTWSPDGENFTLTTD